MNIHSYRIQSIASRHGRETISLSLVVHQLSFIFPASTGIMSSAVPSDCSAIRRRADVIAIAALDPH